MEAVEGVVLVGKNQFEVVEVWEHVFLLHLQIQAGIYWLQVG